MPRQSLIYSVLIASPADLAEERDLIDDVIADWNSANSRSAGALLEGIRWERDVSPEIADGPQRVVNRQVVEWCDMCIALFWQKVGTPTIDSESGTIEEIEQFISSGRPVLLYFSDRQISPSSHNAEEYARVTAAKKRYFQMGIAGCFESVEDLRRTLTRDLARWMHRLRTSDLHRTLDSLPNIIAQPHSDSSTHVEIANDLRRVLKRFETGWSAEQSSSMPNTQEGQYLAEELGSDLRDIAAEIDNHAFPEVSRLIHECIVLSKEIRDHRLVLDGGKSFRTFWAHGANILHKLGSALQHLESS